MPVSYTHLDVYKRQGGNSAMNAEAIRTVKSIKNKWAPAKINGQAVRYLSLIHI